MILNIYTLVVLIVAVSCKKIVVEEIDPVPIRSLSIFEIYLKDPKTLDDISFFLRDTLQLPVEWEPFDFFGNGVVYDVAFYLGNTTLELVSLYAGDSTMSEAARFNRLLFGTGHIEDLSIFLNQAGLQHNPPSDFNIFSGGTRLTIGKQTTLDTLSNASNVYVSFWQYLPAGLDFAERPVSATSEDALFRKLNSALESNPMGIMGLKEVHLSIPDEVIHKWHKFLGTSEHDAWELENGPVISFALSPVNTGVNWITIKVKHLDKAKQFLSSINLLSVIDDKIAIDRARMYGLKIFLEE